jgi:phospholipid/cholesterol/gamma-HCH transport system substrate-binding protein
MQKQAPSPVRILTMVMFALSCFGLLLFLWLSFGGVIPLKPEGYRMKVALPEATQLGLEADVRVAGVRVGKVKSKQLDTAGNRTVATLEIERKFAPVNKDAKAILRQKTLLGETYLELTPGTQGGPTVPENGTLGAAQVQPTVELDEIFEAFDPITRQAFQTWQTSLADSFRGRGQDFSDALGNLPSFAQDGSAVLKVLDSERTDLSRLVRDTGSVFAALSQDPQALQELIVNSERVFSATASQNEKLAETFQIFPTFLDESKATLARLRTFALNTDPLIKDLRPVARDLGPTLRDVRLFAPDLKNVLLRLDSLTTVSQDNLPALVETLGGLKPLLASVGPFAGQLNPILEWLEFYNHQVSDFIGGAASGLAATTTHNVGTGHYLRQASPIDPAGESVGIFPTRLAKNRGNTYLEPLFGTDPELSKKLIFPNWDCNNAGGEQGPNYSAFPTPTPGCFVQKPIPFKGFGGTTIPFVAPESY